MKLNEPLPISLIIWVVSFLPRDVPGATVPRPGTMQTLWTPPLPFGMSWHGVPVTSGRSFSNPPDPNAAGLTHFGTKLTFDVDKKKQTIVVKCTPLSGVGHLEFARLSDGKSLDIRWLSCKPKATVTSVKRGKKWTTILDIVGSARLAASIPAIGLNGRFVFEHDMETWTNLEFQGGVIGFPAHECIFVADRGQPRVLFKMESDPAGTADSNQTFGFGRPVFFDEASEPPVMDHFLNGPGNTATFSNAQEVNDFFVTKQGKPLHEWFNSTLALRGAFARPGVKLDPSDAGRQRLTLLLDKLPLIFGTPKVPLIRVISVLCIVVQESQGFSKLIEDPKARGLAYCFEYDGLPSIGNKTLYDQFADADFWAAHNKEPGASHYDPSGAKFEERRKIWKTEKYPGGVSREENLSKNGYIMQADFYKFIGHGLFQLTGRSNFEKVIEFIQGYTGTDELLKKYRNEWTGRPPKVATQSKVSDWEALFTDGQLLPALSIRIHSDYRGRYLNLASHAAGLNNPDANASGSLAYMAARINISKAYAYMFRARVRDFTRAIAS